MRMSAKYVKEEDGPLIKWLYMFRESVVLKAELGTRAFEALVEENRVRRNLVVLNKS